MSDKCPIAAGVPSEDELDPLGLPKHLESDKIHVAGVIIASYSHEHSHWNAQSSLSAWLKRHGVPAIAGVDTRLLTKRIRDKGGISRQLFSCD